MNLDRENRTVARKPSAPPCAKFAVVTDPGTLFQKIDAYAMTMRDALEWSQSLREDGLEADVMRIAGDGSLTTEL